MTLREGPPMTVHATEAVRESLSAGVRLGGGAYVLCGGRMA